MTKLGQKQDLVEDKEKKTSWSKVWAVCCLCLSTSLSRSMLKLQGNNQDAGKVLSTKIEMFLSRKIPTSKCYCRGKSNLRVTAADFGLPGKSLGGFGIPHSSSDESWKTNTKVKILKILLFITIEGVIVITWSTNLKGYHSYYLVVVPKRTSDISSNLRSIMLDNTEEQTSPLHIGRPCTEWSVSSRGPRIPALTLRLCTCSPGWILSVFNFCKTLLTSWDR